MKPAVVALAPWPRRAFTFVEILLAVALLAVLMLPLLGLMTQGFTETQATIDEVQAANLAAEVVEQLDAVPFQAVPPEGPAQEATLTSTGGTLADGAELVSGSAYRFHLTEMPSGFSRELQLQKLSPTRRDATVTIRWSVKGFARSLRMRRILVKDTILPNL